MRWRYAFPKAISLQMRVAMTSQSVPAFQYMCLVTSFKLCHLWYNLQPQWDHHLNMSEFETFKCGIYRSNVDNIYARSCQRKRYVPNGSAFNRSEQASFLERFPLFSLHNDFQKLLKVNKPEWKPRINEQFQVNLTKLNFLLHRYTVLHHYE
jgi:hypothetical protein